jgi:hypothetical protein
MKYEVTAPDFKWAGKRLKRGETFETTSPSDERAVRGPVLVGKVSAAPEPKPVRHTATTRPRPEPEPEAAPAQEDESEVEAMSTRDMDADDDDDAPRTASPFATGEGEEPPASPPKKRGNYKTRRLKTKD